MNSESTESKSYYIDILKTLKNLELESSGLFISVFKHITAKVIKFLCKIVKRKTHVQKSLSKDNNFVQTVLI